MPSKEIKDLTQNLQAAFCALREKYTALYPDRDVMLTCTYRSPAEQAELYQSGRSKQGPVLTHKDGVRWLSKHNELPSRAFDVLVLVEGKGSYAVPYYEPLGEIAEALGIVWGGSWKRLKDYCHFQEKEETV